MQLTLTAVSRKVPEGVIGWIEELPGANVQGATLAEARESLREAASEILAANRELSRTEFADDDVLRETIIVNAA